MKVTVMTEDERIVMVEVSPGESVENLKAILEVETQIPLPKQHLFFNGSELQDTGTLLAASVKDGDLIELRIVEQRQGAASAPASLALNNDGSARDPVAWLQQFRSSPQLMSLLERNPPLLEAVQTGNVEVLQRVLRYMHEQQRLQARFSDDPLDLEAQRRIEEEIRQKNIAENYSLAYEFNPAQFTSVTMLYVNMEVNNHPLMAFVDSGAEMTIMSQACAERCGLMRLCDTHYSGVAMGVGRDKIVGRIHNVQLKIGPNFYMCGITVLEKARLEFLFGLDMLKRHQCAIDLKDNVLRIGTDNCAVPFLAEHEIPKKFYEMDPESDASMDEANLPPSATALGPASSTGTLPGEGGRIMNPADPPSESSRGVPATSGQSNASQSEAKITRLTELGFDRQSVIEALAVCSGNEEQAAGVLFGG